MNNPQQLKPGQEQHERFYSPAYNRIRTELYYRSQAGKLYRTIANSLNEARSKIFKQHLKEKRSN